MVKKIRIAIVGYGNIGKGVELAIKRNEEYYSDMEVAGIISRRSAEVRQQISNQIIPVVDYASCFDWKNLKADVAILCGGSKKDLVEQGPYVANLLPTVDSYDNHNLIPDYVKKMNRVARKKRHAIIVCGGWDPGTFSVERVLANAFIPGAKPRGFYGLTEKGGLSQGHSDVVRQIKGVVDARQYTHAIHASIDKIKKGENPELKNGMMHWREVYVVIENDTPEERVRIVREIKTDQDYFASYDTFVKFVSQNEIKNKHKKMSHDGLMVASKNTENGNQSTIEYSNSWGSNPEGTGGILVACARACYNLNCNKKIGAFTMLDIPPAFFSPHPKNKLLRMFM